MNISRNGALLALCLSLQGGLLAALTVAGRSGCAPSISVIILAVCFVPYGGAVRLARSVGDKRALDRLSLVAALLFGGTLVLAPPMLSDDLYRYLWEGRLWREGLNPYRLAPDDPSLMALRDATWAGINNKPIASIYPPLSQLVFVAAAALGGTVVSVKLIALAAQLSCVLAVVRISTRPEASLALAINPLLLSEAALNGHFDILTGAALLIAAWSLGRSRFVRAGLATLAAVGLKAIGVLAVPLFWRRPLALVGTAFASALLLLPLVSWRAPVDPSSGAGQFASRWRGNESLFALLDWTSRQLLDDGAAGLAARTAAALLMLALIAIIVRRGVPPFAALRALVWAALLLSPQVHPWYLAWLLPLEVAAGARAGLVWSLAVLFAYAPLDRWLAEGVWDMPLGLQILEYSVVLLAVMLDPRRPRLGPGADNGKFICDSKDLA